MNYLAVFLLVILVGCKTEPPRAPAVGEAYAGPATLSIREDITPQSRVVATVKSGDRLEVLQRRRRFVNVRTAGKVEGWTDERQLLSSEDIVNLRKLSERSKAAPSQGVATTYDTLNVHTTPDRQSPSFLQVKEGQKVDVIGRQLAPRVSPPPPRPPPSPPVSKKRPKKSKDKKAQEIPPPPLPPAPKLPQDWRQLSTVGTEPAPVTPPAPAPPIPMDDWSLIRDDAGHSGWVLTRRLVMAIPDEVAQYAEGRRICSYFPLGETRDGDKLKQSWLWTTVEKGLEPHDFDSFRVFVWSLRRHRYETAHIERNLKGFFPVLTHTVAPPKGRDSAAKVPGFSLLVEKKDGLRYRRSYAFVENRVRFSSEERVDTRSDAPEASPKQPDSKPSPSPPGDSLMTRMKHRLHEWSRRVLGL
jgi:hypothetical protein